VPWYAKAVAAAVAAYALSPIDLIPDFVPVLGYLDDLIIVPAGILLAVKLVPAALMEEFRLEAARRAKPTSPHQQELGAGGSNPLTPTTRDRALGAFRKEGPHAFRDLFQGFRSPLFLAAGRSIPRSSLWMASIHTSHHRSIRVTTIPSLEANDRHDEHVHGGSGLTPSPREKTRASRSRSWSRENMRPASAYRRIDPHSRVISSPSPIKIEGSGPNRREFFA
jgi:hypothetical protein